MATAQDFAGPPRTVSRFRGRTIGPEELLMRIPLSILDLAPIAAG